MKLYSRKYHRNIEHQIHFGIGKSVKTVCGLTLFSRHVLVSVFSDSDGALITDNLERVTCKRCLKTRDARLRKLLAIEKSIPGIFDHETLCGEQWLFTHALDMSQKECDSQKLEVTDGKKTVTLANTMKSTDRKHLLKDLIRGNK